MTVYRFAFNNRFTVTDFLGFCVTQWSAIMFYCSLFTAALSPQKRSEKGRFFLRGLAAVQCYGSPLNVAFRRV